MNRRKTLLKDQGGAAYVEFLIVFLPMYLLFMTMLQAGLLYAGNLVVQHAATTAARSAVVVLPDNPERYDDEPINQIGSSSSSSGGSSSDAVTTLLSTIGGSSAGVPTVSRDDSNRLRAIRSAASIPLLAISPSYSQLNPEPTIIGALGGNPLERAAVGAAMYNRAALAVTFPKSPESAEFHPRDHTFGAHEDITVRVTYMFHCGIPFASRYMCDNVLSLRTNVPFGAIEQWSTDIREAGADATRIQSANRRLQIAQDRVQRAQPGIDELNEAETPWAGLALAGTSARFIVLRAEATMPNQGANYEYR